MFCVYGIKDGKENKEIRESILGRRRLFGCTKYLDALGQQMLMCFDIVGEKMVFLLRVSTPGVRLDATGEPMAFVVEGELCHVTQRRGLRLPMLSKRIEVAIS